jgi:magnesium transporter
MQASSTKEDPSAVRTILYDAVGNDREVRLEDVAIDSLANDQLLWVDVSGTEGVALPAEMQSALGPQNQIGQLQLFDNFYRFAIPLREQPDACLRFAVSHSWILTASDHRLAFFDDFIGADQGETLKGRMTSTAFMAALLMRHLDGFRAEIAHVDLAIDKLDDVILRGREKRSPLNSLAALRRRLSDSRAVLTAQRAVIHGLIAPDFLTHVSSADQEFLVEVNRFFERLEDDIARARETVIGSFELYASRVAQDTNQLLKVLTVATVITGVVGAVAGVFGMNFDTPIPRSGLPGFLLVTGSMIAVSLGFAGIAIWRRWI